MISETNTLLLQLVKRAEQNDPVILEKTFVDTGTLSALLKSPSNQMVYGRRGTGKTHALLFAKANVSSSSMAIYVDLRCVGSDSSIYSDATKPVIQRATRLILDVLQVIHDEMVTHALKHDLSTATLRLLDSLADQIGTIKVDGDIEIERQQGSKSRSLRSTSAGATLGPESVSASLSSNRENEQEIESNDKYIIRGKQTPRIQFGILTRLLSNIIDQINIDRLWLFVDEWSVIPTELQPFLADLFRRGIFPVRKIVVKIAAIEQRSQFKITLNGGDYIGSELGADIGADIDLDDFMVFNNNRDHARNFFAQLIFNHIRALANQPIDANPEELPKQLRTFQLAAFSQEAAFDELVRASEGVPRDAIHILGVCAQKAGESKIGIPIIREAAKAWYQRDKESPISPEGKAALVWIIENVIKGKKARAFLLERTHCSEPLIENLNDLRVLHILKRGISAKDYPGRRFVAFALDYGCYVDLLSTKEAPQFLFMVDEDTTVEVPGEDYRSIRHAALDIAELKANI